MSYKVLLYNITMSLLSFCPMNQHTFHSIPFLNIVFIFQSIAAEIHKALFSQKVTGSRCLDYKNTDHSIDTPPQDPLQKHITLGRIVVHKPLMLISG